MYSRDYRDICGGIALIIIGGSAAIYAMMTLNIGSVMQMGPGMFPAAVGVIMAGLGIAVLIPALFREGEKRDVDLRSLLFVLASILAFALILRPFGLVPAIVVLTLIASRADSKLSPVGVAVLAVILALGATVIFRIILGMQLVILAWPW